MAFQPVVDTVEVTVIYTQNLQSVTNTFNAKKPGGYTQTDLTTLAALVDGLVASSLLPVQTADAVYQQTEVRGLAVENDLFALDGTSSGPGAVAISGLPNNVTLSLKKSSIFTGRSARGRWYFIGLTQSDLDVNENQVVQARVDGAVAAVEALRVGVLTGPFTPVIVSRFTGGAPRVGGLTFDWVSTTSVNRNVDSQRGRLTR